MVSVVSGPASLANTTSSDNKSNPDVNEMHTVDGKAGKEARVANERPRGSKWRRTQKLQLLLPNTNEPED